MTILVAIGLPLLLLVGLLLVVGMQQAQDTASTCAPGGGTAAAAGVDAPAAVVDPARVPRGPVAGFKHRQLVNAAHIMRAAQGQGLSRRDQQIGVMTAIGESGLRVLRHGDTAGPDSRGLFQQRANGAWGTLADRLDPFTSATNFFKVEATIPGRATLEPTLVANKVQRNADPYHYRDSWDPAVRIVDALAGGGTSTITTTGTQSGAQAAAAGGYSLGAVKPQLTAMVNVVGPMFGIKTVGGYRASATDPNGHPAGLAADFMTSGKAQGDALASYAQAHAGELGIDYIIWRQRIWSVGRAVEGWRPMADRGGVTENHFDHVHINVKPDATVTATGGGVVTTAGTSASGQECVTAAGAVNGAWVLPVGDAPVTSGYGPRTNPYSGQASFHDGVDYGAGCGTPIKAASSGVVTRAGADRIYGHLIEIDHGGGTKTRYGHMFADGVGVRVGDQVGAGQTIGQVGKDGWSTGCHLHFTVIIDGKTTDPVPFMTTATTTSTVLASAPTDGALTVATFNTLGHSHTDGPRADRKKYPSSASRTRGLVNLLNASGVQLVGLQEFQPPQQRTFTQLVGNTWAGFGDTDNYIVWQSSVFTVLATDTLSIPYFDGRKRRMPVVRLLHRPSNTTFVVINVHNPADTHGAAGGYRAQAIAKERALVDRIRRTSGVPVLLLGDFNDRDPAFCAVTKGNLLTAAAGGTHGARGCRPPRRAPIDWIFGAGVTWARYNIDDTTLGTISDHPYISATVKP